MLRILTLSRKINSSFGSRSKENVNKYHFIDRKINTGFAVPVYKCITTHLFSSYKHIVGQAKYDDEEEVSARTCMNQ